jgi:copper chaperone CopZ
METTLKITGMSCPRCVSHVGDAISSVPGVTNVKVDLPNGTAKFEADAASIPQIIAALEEEGYPAQEI